MWCVCGGWKEEGLRASISLAWWIIGITYILRGRAEWGAGIGRHAGVLARPCEWPDLDACGHAWLLVLSCSGHWTRAQVESSVAGQCPPPRRSLHTRLPWLLLASLPQPRLVEATNSSPVRAFAALLGLLLVWRAAWRFLAPCSGVRHIRGQEGSCRSPSVSLPGGRLAALEWPNTESQSD